MGVREGQGMAFEFLAPRTALEKPFSLRGRIFHGLPQRSIGKTGVTFLASATRIQNTLPVFTDELPSYHGIPHMPAMGYVHRRINHSDKVYVTGDIHTNTVEGFWSLVKRGMS